MFNNYLREKIGKSSIKNEVSNLICYILGKKLKKEPENFLYKSLLSISHNEFNLGNENDNTFNEDNNIISSSQQNLELSASANITEKKFIKANPIPIMIEGNENEFGRIMKEMYINVDNYLKEIMKCNNISGIKEIFESSIIKNQNYNSQKYRGFLIYSTENIYITILKFYHGLVGNNPPRYSLLLCNDETTLEELISFIYLALFCPYHSLFIIAKPDRLNIDIIYEMENIIEKFYENGEKKINSYILFLFNEIGKSEIGKELMNMNLESAKEPKEDLRAFNLGGQISTDIKIKNKDYFKYIEVVSSIRAGLGKTFYIKKKCIEENIEYISFPIGGEVKRQTIMRRLKDLSLDKSKKYGLHLDFSDTKQKELFEDFIFTFLIQKVYTNNENIICYEDNVKIYIEIPNGFFNFMDKFKLFNLFYNYKINELPKLEFSENQSHLKILKI
jgi:hypothetical protein